MTTRPQARPETQIDNARTTVTVWRFAPHAETGWHRHEYDYIIVPQTDGELLLEAKDGTETASLTAGKCYFRNAGVEHNVVNAGGEELVFVEIEIK